MSEWIIDNGKLKIDNDLSEWKEYRLGDVAQLVKDTWKVGDEELPYIALEHIVERGLRLQGIGDSNTIASNKFRFNADCFLFGKLRPYFRKLFRPDFEGICSTDIWVVKPKNENDKDFLFYFFANQEFVDFSYSGSSGTRMPRADWNFVSQSKWRFPAPQEQKAIAEVLSSLDDKIDLLHRQNKTLEHIAETIFKKMFQQPSLNPSQREGGKEAKEPACAGKPHADRDWEERPLSFFGEIICGKTPSKKRKEFYNGEIPFIKIPDMHGQTFIFTTDDSLTEEGKNSQIKKTLPVKSICVSCIATVGLVSLTTKESHTNQQINSIIPYKEEYRYYIFLQMKSSYDLLHSMASGGTATLNLNTGNFSKIPILLPDEKILKEFHNKIESLFDKIYKNQQQIHTLEKLRDTLLPKLMSGEMRVKY